MSMSRIRVLGTIWICCLFLAAALSTAGGTSLASTSRKACVTGQQREPRPNGTVFAAVVRRHAVAYHSPRRQPFARFGRLNANGFPTLFSVRSVVVDGSCRTRFLRVQLPMRPNGVTGYVAARDVSLFRVRTRIEVDKSSRWLRLFRGKRRLFQTSIAIGKASTPTPVGRFYVNQRLVALHASGPFGPGALGISAFSNVLTDWTQGGPIGIHGTNQPWSIGRAASDGCIRVHNAIARRLLRAVPAGTPVVVHP
jgi:lipoprotein-anchoring transpeptidase ErfK/SrfK